MDSERKRTAQTLKRLRQALIVGDLKSFESLLNAEPGERILVDFREQKIFLHARLSDQNIVLGILESVAAARLSPRACSIFCNYLTFAKVFGASHRKIQSRLDIVLRALPKMNVGQLIGAASDALHRLLKNLPRVDPIAAGSVANYERLLHDMNGVANDMAYAVLRALNEASKVALTPRLSDLGRTNRELARRRMQKAAMIASELNSLEWMFDAVTYGDLEVSQIDDQPTPVAVLEYADPRRSLLRILAIRRDLILNLNRARAPRLVRETLKSQEAAMLESAVHFYSWLGKIEPKLVDFERLRQLSATLLITLNAEDDLLVAASKGDLIAQTHYTAAAVLRWFMMSAIVVRSALPRGRRHVLSAPDVPIGDIENSIHQGGGHDVRETLSRLTITLPARSHYDLIRHPFVRETDNLAKCIVMGDITLWNVSVREALIAGGKLGDAYGRIWEDFYAQGFKETAWTVLGRNLHIRRAGQLITDIDMLLKRQDLLLVLQIKALAGSSVSPYDHWRNRQTIEWGCRQAAIAACHIEEHPEWLVSVVGRRVAEEIRHVQPLVLTNLDHVDGWRFEGVPVIAEVGRKSITIGAKVTYLDSATGEVVSTRHITRPEEISTERILWTLDNPLEILIAPEKTNIIHRRMKIGDLLLAVPDFEIDPDAVSVSAARR